MFNYNSIYRATIEHTAVKMKYNSSVFVLRGDGTFFDNYIDSGSSNRYIFNNIILKHSCYLIPWNLVVCKKNQEIAISAIFVTGYMTVEKRTIFEILLL